MFSYFYLTVRPAHKTNSLSSNQTALEGRTATFFVSLKHFPLQQHTNGLRMALRYPIHKILKFLK